LLEWYVFLSADLLNTLLQYPFWTCFASRSMAAVAVDTMLPSDPDIVAKRKSVYPWLTAVKGGALCAVCSEFYATRPLPTNHTGTFVTKPFNNWKRSTGSEPKDNKLLKHHQSASHLTACAFESDSEKMSAKQRTVYSMIHKQSLEQQQKQLERLADFADVAYYLFKQEIAHTTH